ncbi:MAG: hypothetical protein CFK52_08625 [Chloracidobacterium sp. CP2_5A]|nr:MAG: hypothetical protein CFK52_08625 [Chloracidobacterium sp. CP2_5A]
MTTYPDLVLPGLDGGTPLGFLATLGLARVLRDRSETPELELAWTVRDGGWVAKLRCARRLNEGIILDALDAALAKSVADHPARLYQALQKEDRADFVAIGRGATASDRRDADFLAAIASNLASPKATRQLQTTRRDYHLGNIESILERTRREPLRRTLFKPWDYADPLDSQSLHLDPSEDRRYAYQWSEPSGDPARRKRGGMLGANRLAAEAWAWFTAWPVGDKLKTLGFTGFGVKDTRWTWPVWEPFTPPDLIPSLLALKPLQDDPIEDSDRRRLRQMGIVAVYRARRILVGKTPNFTPARKVA